MASLAMTVVAAVVASMASESTSLATSMATSSSSSSSSTSAPSLASLNVLLHEEEVFTLLGAEGQLWYVNSGQRMENAMNFRIPVPDNVEACHFTWWSDDQPLDYELLISTRPSSSGSTPHIPYLKGLGSSSEPYSSAMYQPHLNISHSGKVPRSSQIFRISMPCTGQVDAAVDVDIKFMFASGNWTLRRLKVCKRGEGRQGAPEGDVGGRISFSSGDDKVGENDNDDDAFPGFLISLVAAAVVTAAGATFFGVVNSKGGLVPGQGLHVRNIDHYRFSQLQQQQQAGMNTITSSNKSHNNPYEPMLLGSPPQGQACAPNVLLGLNFQAAQQQLHHPPLPPTLPPPNLVKMPGKFEFPMMAGFTSDAESRVTDWVNQQRRQQQHQQHRHQQHRQHHRRTQDEEEEQNEGGMRPTTSVTLEEAEPVFDSVQVDRHRLKLGCLLQEGTFGRVYQGLLQSSKVGGSRRRQGLAAGSGVDSGDDDDENDQDSVVPDEVDIMVKTVLTGSSQTQSQLLVREGVQLLTLMTTTTGTSRSHTNNLHILVPLATTWDGTSPMLLYLYPSHGNLKQYLTKFASVGLSTHQVVKLGVQLLGALAFLHKKKILHRDVAARNCYLGEGHTLQLGDSALSRDLFPGDYHCLGDNENRPVKWMPVEAISLKMYSRASDVWSFGVFMWELMTKAQQPFGDLDPFEVEAYLKDGYRLHQPMNCPDQLYSVLAACWGTMPHERASVQSLHATLQALQKQLQQFV